MKELSENTKAVLLLTAPLITGKARTGVKPLSNGEYRQIVSVLVQNNSQPADLIRNENAGLLEACGRVLDSGRLEQLLGRGLALGMAVSEWASRAIWVVSRSDPEYPAMIKRRLQHNSPPLIFGCGRVSILDGKCLAVVGSREIDEETISFAHTVGRFAAGNEVTVVSGGARGVDSSAMHGSLENGGKAVGFLSDNLFRGSVDRDLQEFLAEGRLLLASPFDPSSGFSVGNAMQRNKLIYSSAQAALVVQATLNKGGTWAGAVEELKRKSVSVYLRMPGKEEDWHTALLAKGARRCPELNTTEDFSRFMKEWSGQMQVDKDATESPNYEPADKPVVLYAEDSGGHYSEDSQDDGLEKLLRFLKKPRTVREVAEEMKISSPKAKEVLENLVSQSLIEKISKKPAAYCVRSPELFDSY